MQKVREQITKMEEKLRALKRIARCPREPISGLGGAIQRVRQKAGISLSQLSASTKISKGNLSRIETTVDADTRILTLVSIAKALKVPTTKLLSEAGIK